jgi:hypothetical protein
MSMIPEAGPYLRMPKERGQEGKFQRTYQGRATVVREDQEARLRALVAEWRQWPVSVGIDQDTSDVLMSCADRVEEILNREVA